MSTLAAQNLATLKRTYLARAPSTRRMRTLLRKNDAGVANNSLAHLLRFASDGEPVEHENEIDLRDGMDNLLAYYSALEIGCLLECVPDPLPTEDVDQAAFELGLPDVQRFYGKHYPLLLPQMLLQRVQGSRCPRVPPRERSLAFNRFTVFLGVVAEAEHNNNIEAFLWFLDDGSWGGYDIDDVLKTFSDPQKLGECLTKSRDRSRLDVAVCGFHEFVTLCVRIHELLLECRRAPVTQSALWHYFGYWFVHMRERLGREIDKGLRELRKWSVADRSVTSSGTGHKSDERLRQIIADLTSGAYGSKLETLFVDHQTRERAMSAASDRRMAHDRALLAHLERHPGQRVEQLAAAIKSDVQAMREALAQLVAKGLLRTEGRRESTAYYSSETSRARMQRGRGKSK